MTHAKPNHRDRSGREQARTYTITSRTRDRVSSQYTPLASTSCQTYIVALGT